MNILIVDDYETNRVVLFHILQKLGYTAEIRDKWLGSYRGC